MESGVGAFPALSAARWRISGGAAGDSAGIPVTTVESHEVLREAFEKASPKEIAALLGVSLSLVYKWSQPPGEGQGSGSLNPLDRTRALMEITRDPGIIKWLCQVNGGYFVLNPGSGGAEHREVGTSMNAIIQQFADFLSGITKAATDHRITEEESQEIRRNWDDLKTLAEGFVRACEDGDFGRMGRGSLMTERG